MANRRTFLARSLALSGTLSFSRVFAASAATTRPDAHDDRRAITINAPSGPVRGAVGVDCRVFKGIPFAQPPIGPLRFKPPVPLAPTVSTRNAFAFGPAPMQKAAIDAESGARMIGEAVCSEDCLYLNVWTPATPGPHPVFVWIYGGSNTAGATSEPIYDGSTFARDGVVCVTLGYRLGAFGFLELGDLLGESYRGSGNNALRDQVLGLEWVRDNIAAFGGDPGQVTVGGESAGAKNVSALLAVPAARGLFRAAIVESGSGQTVHSLEQASEVTQLFASMFARAGGTPVTLLSAPADTVLAAQNETIAAYPRAFAFRSIVDHAILPQRPLDAVAAGASRDVRLLIGNNRDESLLFFPPALIGQHRRDPAADLPITSKELAHLDPVALNAVAQRYVQAFPAQSPFERRLRLLTSEEYWIPTVRLTDAHAAAGGETYAYRFERPIESGRFSGYAVHASELPFVWENFEDPYLRMFYGEKTPMPVLAKQIHAAWVVFIKGSAPAAAGLPHWTRYVTNGINARQIMLLRAQPALATDPAGDERRLWDGVL